MTSFECLEVLLLMHRERGSEVAEAAVATRTGLHFELVREALKALCKSKLVSLGTAPDTFRYEPATPALAEAVDALAVTYRDNSASVLSTMSVDAIERIRSGSMRAFADAFVLKKGDGEG